MAAPVSKSELGHILVQAKCAATSIRAERDRLLQLQLQLQTTPGGDGDGRGAPPAVLSAPEVITALVDVSFTGLERGARHLTTCLTKAAANGARFPSLPASFAVLSDQRLFDELVALRLPEPPATQAHAFARIEAAFYAVKLPQQHHLPRCVEQLAKINEPAPAPASAATGEPPQPQDSSRMDQARSYLDRACTLTTLAVTHTDLAVAAISSFLDPQDVASINSFVDRMMHRRTR